MSASPPQAAEKRTCREVRVGPKTDMRKCYREPNNVERSCHNLRTGARVLVGNLHPALGGRPAATSRECAQSHILAAYLVAKSAYRDDAFPEATWLGFHLPNPPGASRMTRPIPASPIIAPTCLLSRGEATLRPQRASLKSLRISYPAQPRRQRQRGRSKQGGTLWPRLSIVAQS
jgi:hypothetical protein